jgi:hypothetical protein
VPTVKLAPSAEVREGHRLARLDDDGALLVDGLEKQQTAVGLAVGLGHHPRALHVLGSRGCPPKAFDGGDSEVSFAPNDTCQPECGTSCWTPIHH